MNTQTIKSTERRSIERNWAKTSAGLNAVDRLGTATQHLTRLFISGGAFASVLILATWLIAQQAVQPYLLATLWAGGFVFLALAVESSQRKVLWAVVSGFAFPAIALLSNYVSGEWAFASAPLVAGWVAWFAWKR